MTPKEFIAKVKDPIKKEAAAHGIKCPGAVIAQAALESGWGSSGLTVKANNLFGIKAGKSWTGEKYTVKTKEFINGRMRTVTADFRKYTTWPASIKDYFKLMDVKRYANLKGVTSVKTYSELLKKDGYATDPAYPGKIQSIYNKYVKGA